MRSSSSWVEASALISRQQSAAGVSRRRDSGLATEGPKWCELAAACPGKCRNRGMNCCELNRESQRGMQGNG